jgi:hypothetical protein
MVRINLGSVMLLMFTYHFAVAGGKMNDAHLDGLLVHCTDVLLSATLQFERKLTGRALLW